MLFWKGVVIIAPLFFFVYNGKGEYPYEYPPLRYDMQ